MKKMETSYKNDMGTEVFVGDVAEHKTLGKVIVIWDHEADDFMYLSLEREGGCMIPDNKHVGDVVENRVELLTEEEQTPPTDFALLQKVLDEGFISREQLMNVSEFPKEVVEEIVQGKVRMPKEMIAFLDQQTHVPKQIWELLQKK